ncbi:hypothetical protein MKW94_007582 [Papaver nudicaule]|uniref:Uncharacterized protein n=1 Tax=Papaver nudicaule TaxID=74823 RepID=A0AA41VS65_PAPNU|nr:hypothetical protein [Papaver nudicaule]
MSDLILLDMDDFVRKYAEYAMESDENDTSVYVADWEDCDEWNFLNDDDEGDEEKQTLEVSGTRTDNTQLISHVDMGAIKGDVEPMEEDKLAANKATNEEASEEDMSTEMKEKKEKRKSQEDGVESEQNDRIETANEVKRKKKTLMHN